MGGMRPSLRRSALASAALGMAAALSSCGEDAENSPSEATVTGDAEPAPAEPEEPASSQPATPETSRTPQPETGTPVSASDLVTGLTSPWGLLVMRDGTMLVSERDTTEIKRVPAGGGTAEVVATVSDARPAGEGGLLGLATTPDESRVFVYYTSETDNRIVSMSWDGRRLGEPQVVLDGIPHGDGDRHEGGRMVVGPDDLLYVTTGETGDTPEMAQDPDQLGGKILRLTLDGEPAPGNPFGDAIYSLGHRNIEGLAFDDRGRLWASEFGDQTWDELNLITPGGNYGWPEVEGSSDRDEFVDPAVVWRTENASPAGVAFWEGSLWMAGLRGETLWEVPLAPGDAGSPEDPGAAVEQPVPHLQGELGRLRTVEVAADGEGLLLATSNTDGRGEPAADDDRILRVVRDGD